MSLQFSIVVNTYNRAPSLANTLEAFKYLRYPNFEVIVVNGPSTDDTEALLQGYSGRLKIGHCTETNLAKSRNIGIGMASGDIICFIDDDGIPEPDWLDALARCYQANPRVGGAGGFVRDHTGVDFQCKYIICNRNAEASFFNTADQAQLAQRPHAEHYYSLIGVNSSFRREALLQIGGFDEEFAYFLDETDVCVRLADAGWEMRFVPDAEVHHKYAPSHLRNDRKIPTSLYYTCRSKTYFLFRNALPGKDLNALFKQAIKVREQIQWDADNLFRFNLIDPARHTSLREDAQRGFTDGIRDAFAHPGGQPMPPGVITGEPFFAFTPLLTAGQRRHLILISQDYPPQNCGGIGVIMHRLAEALAAQGHEISVITKSTGRHTVDMENGVWVHRIPRTVHGDRAYPVLPDLPSHIRDHAYTVYDEALRIQARRGAATTLSTIWDLEAGACIASQAFTNYVYLVTTYQLSLPSKTEWQKDTHYLQHHVNKMIDAEYWLLQNAQHLIASTPGIWADVSQKNPGLQRAHPVPIIPFGLPEAPTQQPEKPLNYPAGINLLFVGRFELRKGVDLLLQIIPELLQRHPSLNIRLAGDDTLHVDGITLKAQFLQRHQDQPEWLKRVHFLGFLSTQALDAEYAHCCIFAAPSRYESFGLIYLEAMRWSKPCVGSNAGGIPDVIDPSCAMLPEPGDASALMQALQSLITQPDLRLQMGQAGKARFLQHFAMGAYTQRLLTEISC